MPADDDADSVKQHLLVIACGDYPPESGYDSFDISGEIAVLDGWLSDSRLGRRAFSVLAPDLRSNPTKRQIDDAFDGFRRGQVRRYDRVFVYITGHGETINGAHHLVLTELVTLGHQRRYRTSEIVTNFQDLGVEHAIFMIDTCAATDIERGLFTLDHDLPPGYLIVSAAEESAYVGGLSSALKAFIERGVQDTLSPYLDSLELWRACGEYLAEQEVHLYPSVARAESVRRSPCLPNPYFDDSTSVADSDRIEASFLVPDEVFTGRHRLMTDLLKAARGPQTTTIVTGGAGSGKSAALRRLVAFSDAGFRVAHDQTVREARPGTLPRAGEVNIAVLATGRTSLDLVDQLSRAFGAEEPLSASLSSRIKQLIGLLSTRGNATVVIDAIDEARDARHLVTDVLKPLAESGCVRLIVGVRGAAPTKRSDEPTLLDWTKGMLQASVIAVDVPPYWADEDLVDCADILLRAVASRHHAEQPDSVASRQLAARIATASGRSFLLARLLASDPAVGARSASLPDYDAAPQVAAALAEIITAELGSTLDLEDRGRAVTLLRATAFSFGLGIPRRRIWPKIATAIAGGDTQYGDADVRWLLHQHVGGYLTRDTDGDVTVYRPFHAVLGEALSQLDFGGKEPATGLSDLHSRIFDELAPLASERVIGGATVPPDWYIARYLAEHAAVAGRLDDVLTDPQYLTASDPHRLLTLLDQARSDLAKGAAAAYRSSAPTLIGRSCRERASFLEFTARQQDARQVAERFAATFPDRPWASRWARWTQAPQHLVLANGLVKTIGLAVSKLPLGLAIVVAEAQGTVRALDIETGRELWTKHVNAPTCLSTAADIVAVGTESEIVLLDAATGSSRRVVRWEGGKVCAIALTPEASLLAAGNYSGRWEADPAIICVWKRSATGSGFTKLWSAPAFEMGIMSLSWRSSSERAELVVGGDPYGQPDADLNLARIFDGTTGTLIASLPTHSGQPATARASRTGRIVTLQGTSPVRVTVWKTDNSEPELAMTTTIKASAIAWDLDGQTGAEAVIGADDECICRIEMRRDSEWTPLVYEPRAEALTMADGLLITVSRTGTLTRWDLNRMRHSTARRVNITRAWSAQAGSLIFSTSRDEPGVGRVEDAMTGSEVRRESCHPALDDINIWTAVTAVDEHDLLLVGDTSGRVHGRRSSAVDEEVFLWQIHKRRPNFGTNRVNSITLYDDILVTAGDDGAVRFTNWRTGQQALPPVTYHGWCEKPMLTAVVVTEPGGEAVILAGDTSDVLLCWQLSSLSSATDDDGFSVTEPTKLTDADYAANFSLLTLLRQPNGLGQLAIPSGSWSSVGQGNIRIFDIATRTDHRWRAHDREVVALCDSGDLLYSADSSGVVRCWADVQERTPRLVSELATNSSIIALLPLANEYIAIVSTSGLAVTRCEAPLAQRLHNTPPEPR